MKIKIPFVNKIFVLDIIDNLDGQLLKILNNRKISSYDHSYSYPDRIEAIKFLRSNKAGIGLVEAKDYVDNLVIKYNISVKIKVN